MNAQVDTTEKSIIKKLECNYLRAAANGLFGSMETVIQVHDLQLVGVVYRFAQNREKYRAEFFSTHEAGSYYKAPGYRIYIKIAGCLNKDLNELELKEQFPEWDEYKRQTLREMAEFYVKNSREDVLLKLRDTDTPQWYSDRPAAPIQQGDKSVKKYPAPKQVQPRRRPRMAQRVQTVAPDRRPARRSWNEH